MKYWTHASPMPLRRCAVCDKEFQPENVKRRGHNPTCSDHCGDLFRDRNWKAAHPDELREQDKKQWKRKKSRMLPSDLSSKPNSWQKIVPVLVADRAAGGKMSNQQAMSMFGLKISKETMNDMRRYCEVPGPRGRPAKMCK